MQIVAELGANHGGSLDTSLSLVRAARECGATAVKLQTWTPGKMVLDPRLKIESGPWEGWEMARLYEEALLPWSLQRQVFSFAAALGIECFSSVFDRESVDFLEVLGCPRYKIASFELVDLPLIEYTAGTGKPIIMSTGMATVGEIDEAVDAARQGGAKHITLLQCTSAYPASPDNTNLRAMAYLHRRFGVASGLSDHTQGIGVAIAAAAMGATMVEKHFTLLRAPGGLDTEFSIEPEELVRLVEETRRVVRILGRPVFGPRPEEAPQLKLRRSLHFAESLSLGSEIKLWDVRSARPAGGLPPRFLERIIGRRVTRHVTKGQPVLWDDISAPPAMEGAMQAQGPQLAAGQEEKL